MAAYLNVRQSLQWCLWKSCLCHTYTESNIKLVCAYTVYVYYYPWIIDEIKPLYDKRTLTLFTSYYNVTRGYVCASLYYNGNPHSRKVLRTRRPAAHEVQAQWVARFDYLFHAPPPILFPELRLVLVLRTLPSSRNSLTQLFVYPTELLLQVCCMLLLSHIYFCLEKV